MHRYDRPRRALACGMAALAGFVDATGFVAAGGYFVSLMSGNTTRLGVDLAGRAAAAIVPALLIAGFIAGVVAGALVAAGDSRRRKTRVLALAAVLIAIAALSHSLGSARIFLAASVLAMGALNNAFSRGGEVAVGVTYMTGALVRFGQGLAGRLMGNAPEGAGASLALWSSLASGAVAGALATSHSPAGAPWLPVLAVLALLWAASRIERVDQGS
jgi:uncharacterized membrane protein YoaK (UPF0700 family)